MMSLVIGLLAFFCGFVTDKLRVFPLLIGIVIGYLIKTSVDTADIKTYFGTGWEQLTVIMGGRMFQAMDHSDEDGL